MRVFHMSNNQWQWHKFDGTAYEDRLFQARAEYDRQWKNYIAGYSSTKSLRKPHHFPSRVAFRVWWRRMVNSVDYLLTQGDSFQNLETNYQYWFSQCDTNQEVILFIRSDGSTHILYHWSNMDNSSICMHTLEKIEQEVSSIPGEIYSLLGSNDKPGSVVSLHPYLTGLVLEYLLIPEFLSGEWYRPNDLYD
jgi:hypothetical protein